MPYLIQVNCTWLDEHVLNMLLHIGMPCQKQFPEDVNDQYVLSWFMFNYNIVFVQKQHHNI